MSPKRDDKAKPIRKDAIGRSKRSSDHKKAYPSFPSDSDSNQEEERAEKNHLTVRIWMFGL